MTVIIGYVDPSNSEMYMACDTLICSSDYTQSYLKSKIQKFEGHNVLIGYAGNLAPIQYIRNKITIDEPYKEGMDLFEYVVRTFAEPMMDLLDGYLRDGDSFGALIALEGRIFEVDERGLVEESLEPFRCMGSGDKVAYGSLYTTKYMGYTVEEKLNRALEVTEKVIFNVGHPFIIERIKYKAEDNE